jgi:hypothetical protein
MEDERKTEIYELCLGYIASIIYRNRKILEYIRNPNIAYCRHASLGLVSGFVMYTMDKF